MSEAIALNCHIQLESVKKILNLYIWVQKCQGRFFFVFSVIIIASKNFNDFICDVILFTLVQVTSGVQFTADLNGKRLILVGGLATNFQSFSITTDPKPPKGKTTKNFLQKELRLSMEIMKLHNCSFVFIK